MKANRSIPPATVIPVLIYPDVRAAVSFLEEAFGFTERLQIGEDHRSQLTFGDGALIVGDVRHGRVPPRPGEATHDVMLRVDDARAHCERAPARRERRSRWSRRTSSTASGSTTAPTRGVTGGRSRRRSRTSIPPPGAESSNYDSRRRVVYDLRRRVVDPLPPPQAIEFIDTKAVVGVTKWPRTFQSLSLLS